MTTWVLLRGLMREARHWGEFLAQFNEVAGTNTIVTLDFPGNGSLHGQRSASSVTEMTEFCRLQLQQMGHYPPYRLLAMSLGAMVAVDWATRYPVELDCMVLINTSLAPYSPFYWRLRPANYLALFGTLLLGSKTQQQALILRITSNAMRSKQQRMALLKLWVGYARECPVTRGNVRRQLCAAAGYHAVSGQPLIPVLLLTGQQDQLVDSRCSEVLAARWQCPIKRHPTAGHDLPLDEGVWVTQQVKDWLGTQPQKSPVT